MLWDDELKRLSRSVRDTFGEGAWEDAIHRALDAQRKAMPDDRAAPFDDDAVCQNAIRLEFRRLLQPH
jgi:hypothetical protein